MLSSLSPSTPIRNCYCNHSMKVAAPSPRSVQSPTTTTYISPTTNTKFDNKEKTEYTMNKSVEGQVSFRTATRRFSCNATVVVPLSPASIKQQLPKSVPRIPNSVGSTQPRRIVGSVILSTQPPPPYHHDNHHHQQEQERTLSTMEPLEIGRAHV